MNWSLKSDFLNFEIRIPKLEGIFKTQMTQYSKMFLRLMGHSHFFRIWGFGFRVSGAALLTFFLMLFSAFQTRGAEKDHVVVVYNPKLDGSKEIAEYYAAKRGLAQEQLIAIACTPNESVSRAEFVEFIQKPLIEELEDRGWWKTKSNGDSWKVTSSRLKYLVLCHGIPLKIEEPPPAPNAPPAPNTRSELSITRAAVDTELALIPSPQAPTTGFVQNPFFGKNSVDDLKDWNLQIVLVTRLDGPNPDACKRLIDSAIAGEEHGIWGRAIVDARGITTGAYAQGDQWLNNLADFLKIAGWNPTVDRIESTLADPGPFQSCALYAGWYSDSICGPMADPNFRFVPGAIVYHIHSFSAQSLRTFDRHWAGPLVARGVAATMGCVDEPYLQFTPFVDFFFKQLFFGRNFAQAAYLSIPVLSWQITVVGDPLYRPFNRDFDRTFAEMSQRKDPDLPWAHLRKAGQMAAAGMIDPAILQLETARKENSNGLYPERLAQLYAEKKDYASAIRIWKECIGKMNLPALKAWYLLWLARTEWDAGMLPESMADYRRHIEQYPDHPARLSVAMEARDKAVQKGMKTDSDYFDQIIAPPPPPAPQPAK